MDEVKGKVKDFMKKINKPFSASGSKFAGQGRVLGSSSTTPSPNPSAVHRNSQPTNPPFNPNPKEPIQKKPSESESELRSAQVAGSNRGEFDPFDAHISSNISSRTGSSSGTTSLNMFQCPLCNEWFNSEQQVSSHVDTCLENNTQHAEIDSAPDEMLQEKDELAIRVATFLSGKPSDKTIDVILKLLRNVVSDPANEKFRRIRMSNPRIQETVGEAVGGVDLLECVGFSFHKEGEAEDTWGVMEIPSAQGIRLISEAIGLLEQSSASSTAKQDPLPPRTIDRKVRVFFAAPDNMAAKIELPDSFYELSPADLRREAESRKKKIEDSQLLIPKSFREKQAKAVRRRYKATVIRIQFPDGVILQGIFLPSEPTSALYEFAKSALKEKCLDFELLGPAVPKSSVIPCSVKTGKKMATLEDEGLVPAVLIKFKPIETDSVVFTGLRNELLAMSEPLTPEAFPSDVEFKLVYQGS